MEPDGPTDAHTRAKDFLNPAEMDRLLDGAKRSRYGARDHLLILMTYRHGLRVSELVSLRKADVKLTQARLWVERLKGGLSVEHPIPGDELRAIKRYLATRDDHLPWLFLSDRGQPLSRKTVFYLVQQAGKRAGLANVHPHTFRHSCGYTLPTKAPTYEPSRITLATATRATPRITRALLASV